jgi:hypothetical protein
MYPHFWSKRVKVRNYVLWFSSKRKIYTDDHIFWKWTRSTSAVHPQYHSKYPQSCRLESSCWKSNLYIRLLTHKYILTAAVMNIHRLITSDVSSGEAWRCTICKTWQPIPQIGQDSFFANHAYQFSNNNEDNDNHDDEESNIFPEMIRFDVRFDVNRLFIVATSWAMLCFFAMVLIAAIYWAPQYYMPPSLVYDALYRWRATKCCSCNYLLWV